MGAVRVFAIVVGGLIGSLVWSRYGWEAGISAGIAMCSIVRTELMVEDIAKSKEEGA